jgi:hypothetical protein
MVSSFTTPLLTKEYLLPNIPCRFKGLEVSSEGIPAEFRAEWYALILEPTLQRIADAINSTKVVRRILRG